MSDDLPDSSTSINDTGAAGDSPNGTSERVGTSGAQSSVIGRPLESPSVPTIVGLVAAVTAALAVLRYAWSWARPKPKTADEKLAEATAALGTAAAGLGGRAAKRTVSVAERTVSVAEPVVRQAASRAADVAQDAAGLAAGSASKVAAVAAGGASEVADGVEAVQKAWRKFTRRLIILVFGSAGYVLGARAGRERYDQIVGVAQKAQGAAQGARQ
jgi:hypothetical protein